MHWMCPIPSGPAPAGCGPDGLLPPGRNNGDDDMPGHPQQHAPVLSCRSADLLLPPVLLHPQVDLTARIREVLLNYPEGTSILKELVQVGLVRPSTGVGVAHPLTRSVAGIAAGERLVLAPCCAAGTN